MLDKLHIECVKTLNIGATSKMWLNLSSTSGDWPLVSKVLSLVVECFISSNNKQHISTGSVPTGLVLPNCCSYHISAAGTNYGWSC